MRKLILLFILTAPLWARTSVTVTAAGSLSASLPNVAPFNAMTSGIPARWEFRLHNVSSLPSDFFEIPTQQLITSGATHMFITQKQNSPQGDVAPFVSLLACCSTVDYDFRIQRDTANNQYTVEACDVQTGICTSQLLPATFGTTTDWTGKTLKIFSGYSVAYLRWFSTVVPVGTAIAQGLTGDVADWEFQSSLVDSVHGITFAGSSVDYLTNTPLYPPSCVPGVQTSFRAGGSGSVDGSQSLPLDFGTTLTYMWQQQPGVSPTTVRWTSPQNAATATFTGMVFGSYNMTLTVTDSRGVPNSCTVHDGAVSTDSQGLVQFPNTAFGNAAKLLLGGGQVQYGKNPWQYQDVVFKSMSDQQGAIANTIFAPVWDVPLAGTVTTANNSMNVTGTGTNFQTDFCGGGTVGDGSYFVWWPTVSVVNGPNTARKLFRVVTCTDNTHLILENGVSPPHDDSTAGIVAAGTYQYSKMDVNHFFIWDNGGWSNPADYYDNGAAQYALYFKTGFDTTLNYARTLMDNVWESPLWDRGRSASPQVGNAYGPPPRAVGYIGLVLRALDSPPYDMWVGLRLISNSMISAMGPSGNDRLTGWKALWDTREEAYHLTIASICALVDPDATQQAACRNSINDSFPNVWSAWGPDPVDGSWKCYYNQNGPLSSSTIHAQVTNGSTAVVGVGGTNWTTLGFPKTYVQFWDTDPNVIPGAGAFWLGPNPRSNLAGQNTYYEVVNVTDDSHMTLSRPYAGATNATAGFAFAPINGDTGFLGWGTQPFMQSVLAGGFDLAAQALTCTGGPGVPSGCNATTAALARTYQVSAATYVKTVSFLSADNGLWYGSGFLNCQTPGGPTEALCSFNRNGNTNSSAEGWRGLHTTYVYNQDATWKTFLNTLHNAIWAKPGTCLPASPCDDSANTYNTDTEPATGFYAAPVSPWITTGSPKWYGTFFGVGVNGSWPYWAMGGIIPKVTASAPMQFHGLTDIPTAAKVVVTATSTDGGTAVTTCVTPTCVVTLATNRGKNLLTWVYQTAGGAALAPGSLAIEK